MNGMARDLIGSGSIGGLLILLVKLHMKTSSKIEKVEAKKVCNLVCEDRRKDINASVRAAIDKLDRFKDEQSKEHQDISEKLGKIWGKMNGGNKDK